MLAEEFDAQAFQLEVSDDGEQMRMHYPSVLEVPGDYVGNSVLIEFGGRNITEPNEEHEVRPDIAEHVAELDFLDRRSVCCLRHVPSGKKRR